MRVYLSSDGVLRILPPAFFLGVLNAHDSWLLVPPLHIRPHTEPSQSIRTVGVLHLQSLWRPVKISSIRGTWLLIKSRSVAEYTVALKNTLSKNECRSQLTMPTTTHYMDTPKNSGDKYFLLLQSYTSTFLSLKMKPLRQNWVSKCLNVLWGLSFMKRRF